MKKLFSETDMLDMDEKTVVISQGIGVISAVPGSPSCLLRFL
jgi:hypothetical protein